MVDPTTSTILDLGVELNQARDAALPPAPTYTWDFKTRAAWRDYLKTLDAKAGPLPKGVLQGIQSPMDGTGPLDPQLWSLLMMGRGIATDALGIAPTAVPIPTTGAGVVQLLSALTRALASAPLKTLQDWLNTEL